MKFSAKSNSSFCFLWCCFFRRTAPYSCINYFNIWLFLRFFCYLGIDNRFNKIIISNFLFSKFIWLRIVITNSKWLFLRSLLWDKFMDIFTMFIGNILTIIPWLILTSIMGYEVTFLIRNVFTIIPRNLVAFSIWLFYSTIILNIITFSFYKDCTIVWIFNPNFVITIRERLTRISTLPMFGATSLTLVNAYIFCVGLLDILVSLITVILVLGFALFFV